MAPDQARSGPTGTVFAVLGVASPWYRLLTQNLQSSAGPNPHLTFYAVRHGNDPPVSASAGHNSKGRLYSSLRVCCIDMIFLSRIDSREERGNTYVREDTAITKRAGQSKA